MNWAYIAGFFDGEGHVSFVVGHDGGRTKRPPRLSLTQAEPQHAVLYQISEFLAKHGIHSGVHRHMRPNPRHQPCHKLEIGRMASVRRFLVGVLPYLVVKKDQADKAIACIDSGTWGYLMTEEMKRKISKTLTGRKLSDETRARDAEGVARSWQNPEIRAKRLAGLKVFWGKPESRRKHSEAIREYWKTRGVVLP